MSFTDILGALRRRWAYIVVAVVLGVGGAVAAIYETAPAYQATATVYFSVPIATSGGDLAQGGVYTQQQLASYAALATQPMVLGPVIDDLGLKTSAADLAASISVSVSPDTVMTTISATNGEPVVAANIANAVARQLGETVKGLSPKSDTGKPTIDYAVSGRAVPPQSPVSPNKKLDLGAGLLGGLIIGLLAAFARERFDDRIWKDSDLRELPSLGTIPFHKAATKRGASPLIADWLAPSARAEAFRQLRTSLQFVDVDHPPKLVTVTSAQAAEGKSGLAANLAAAFAEAGQRVLLVDADLRRPSIAEYFDISGQRGLTNVLAGHVKVAQAIQDLVDHPGLSVLPSGSVPPNPSELLSSRRMADLLARVRGDYDMVLVDTPPLLPVTDASVVAAKSDGVVFVGRYGRSRRADVLHAIDALHGVDARVLGVVINRVPTAKRSTGYGYRGATDGPSGATRIASSESEADIRPEHAVETEAVGTSQLADSGTGGLANLDATVLAPTS